MWLKQRSRWFVKFPAAYKMGGRPVGRGSHIYGGGQVYSGGQVYGGSLTPVIPPRRPRSPRKSPIIVDVIPKVSNCPHNE